MYWTPFMSYSLLVQNIVSTFVEENFGLMVGCYVSETLLSKILLLPLALYFGLREVGLVFLKISYTIQKDY